MFLLPRSFHTGLQVKCADQATGGQAEAGYYGASLRGSQVEPPGGWYQPLVPQHFLEAPCSRHALYCRDPHCCVLTVGDAGVWPGLWWAPSGVGVSLRARVVGSCKLTYVDWGWRVETGNGEMAPGLPPVLAGVEGREWIPAFPAPSLLTWSLGCIVESEPRTLGSLRRLTLLPHSHFWAAVPRMGPKSCSEQEGLRSGPLLAASL